MKKNSNKTSNPTNYTKNPQFSKSDTGSSPNLDRRTTRQNPNSDSVEEQRHQKKIKLVDRLPTSNSPDRYHSADQDVVKDEKATEVLQGSPLEPGPTVPLPDKKLLLLILDRLQKKDTHGAFSEPVNPNELPDYNEIIENPMDFGTMRKKLNEGRYSKFEDFELDVFLICANAMQYNASDTVFFRQAKSIQEIAKGDFENLRKVNEEGEPQLKIVRRGRPSNLMKALERVAPESFSDATLATISENDNNNNIIIIDNNNNIGSNSYILRKGVAPFKSQSTDTVFRGETLTDYTTDWNSEFPAKILKAEAKHAKKQFTTDENRRSTFKQFHPFAFDNDSSSLSTLNRNTKQLIGVGLQSEHGYARSLSCFSTNLGPIVWKFASKKLERVLPGGVNFGPKWIGENDFVHDNSTYHQARSSLSSSSSVLRKSVSNIGSATVSNTQQKHLLHNPNGVTTVSQIY